MPLNGCTVPSKDDPPRDYLAEARAIVAGQSRLMAEAAHLQALLAFAGQQAANVQQCSELIAAYLLERGAAEVVVPTALLEEVRRRQLSLFVEVMNLGVRVRIAAPPPTAKRIHG